MTDRAFGAEDYVCENIEFGEECDYPFCSCEEEDDFGFSDLEDDDTIDPEGVEIEEYD